MGTGNFYVKNASKVYAVLMNYETEVLDDEGEVAVDENGDTIMEYRSPDEWDVDCELDYIKERIEDTLKDDFMVSLYEGQKYKDVGISFSSIYLAQIEKYYHVEECGFDVYFLLTAFLTNGYYEGACLDWEIETYLENYCIDYQDLSDIGSSVNDYAERYLEEDSVNVTDVSIKIQNWLTENINKAITDLEKVYAEVSTPMQVFASFSNGETMYKVCDDKK